METFNGYKSQLAEPQELVVAIVDDAVMSLKPHLRTQPVDVERDDVRHSNRVPKNVMSIPNVC